MATSIAVNPDFVKDLKHAQLRFIDSSVRGISRRKTGNGFQYFDFDGRITSKTILDRIKSLKIPPAWTKVWVCPSSTGYLQATGLDIKGRKQYIYHPEWRRICQENKFSKLSDFGKVLPKIRDKVKKDILGSQLDKERVLATVIWLLEHTFIRVGNEEYAKENAHFGLTTLRNKHVKVRGKTVKFEFKGKSGVDHTIEVIQPAIAKVIKACIELPGYEIFQYIDEAGFRHSIDSENVNLYLKQVTGEDITAKEFRTWGGTTLSAVTLNKFGPYDTEDSLRRNLHETISQVAKHLGNTVKVCQSYYIHPTIIETYRRNVFIPNFRGYMESKNKIDGLSKEEFAVLNILNRYS